MGASGSMVANKDDGGVEVNIADEASATRAISRHHSQPPSTLLASLIPKKHGDGLHRPTANIRSSGSFDPSNAAMMLPDMNDKIRKEYDTLKFTKEQEIQALQRKEQKLDTENNRLRAELQALNKQCQKLRAERDIAMESSYEATERATALEQDREKIQRQFKIFRETKESEIQALLQAKRQFETQLQSLQAYGVATLDDQTYSKNDASNHLDDAMRPASEWWAPPESEATSLFGSYAQLRNGSNVGFAESAADIREQGRVEDGSDFVSPPTERQPWMTNGNSLPMVLPLTNSTDICGSIILRCYVGGTPDVIRDLKSIVNHPELEATKSACEKEGYFLSVTNLTDLSDYTEERQENEDPAVAKVELIQSAVHRSSIFIFIIGDMLGKYTDAECQEGHFNSPGSKSTFFCLKNSTQGERDDMPSAELKQRVTASHCRRKFHYETSEEVFSLTLKCISKAVQLEFGIKASSSSSQPPEASGDSEQHEVVCIDEMPSDEHMEQMQQSIMAPPDLQPVGFEKSYERLDEVVTSPGPVPPLLISGTRGSGKTLLLTSWIRRLKSTSPDILVLQHFVTGIEALDADPVIMLRRLLSQLRHHLPLANQPPVQTFSTFDVTRLRETLPRWLEQLTSRRNNRILLVVDSIDLLKEAQRNFHWLLDPLHVGVRVVISAGVDSCPEEWRTFPTLHLEPLSVQSVKSLLQEHASFRGITLPRHTEREVVSQCRTATTCHPLYVALLSSVACSSCVGDSAGESLFGACLRSRDSSELYRVLLRDVESRAGRKQTRSCIKALFQFLVCSRGGLAETEIMGLVPDLTWSIWTSLRRQLVAYCVIDDTSGLVMLHNSEISSVLYDCYVSNEVQQRRVHHKMAHWLQQAFARQVTPRNSDLLLWLLHKVDDREALRKVLASPVVFHFMYSRGRACEVVRLWNFLNEEKSLLAGYYRNSLQRLEATAADAASSYVTGVVTMSDVAQMYLSLGRFLKDLGLMEEAVSSLQKSLEIQESILDPDHPAVADSLHHLAAVYTQWGKLSTAEPLYRQALELVECAVGRDHLRIAQELSALVRINRKTGRREVADSLQQRMLSIMKRNSSFGSNNFKRLMKRAVRLEELTLGDDTLDTAQALNDLGVLYHMQNNLDQAESFFKRSLKTREKLVGGSHLDVAQSYHNLAAVYNEKKNFKQASVCMATALNIRKGLLHVGDPAVLTSMKYLAALYKKCKNPNKSAEVYRQILTATQQQSSPNSVPAANAMVNVAVAECELGQLDTALPLYERALEIYRKVLGHSSPQVFQALRNIAVLLYQKGNVAEAAAAYKQSMGGGSSKANSASRW